MINTEEMELLSTVVFKDKVEDVISSLVRLEIFHPVDIRNIEYELKNLSSVELQKEYEEWDFLSSKLNDSLRKLKFSVPLDTAFLEMTSAKVKSVLEELSNKADPLVFKREELLADLRTKETIFSQMKEYLALPIDGQGVYTFLQVEMGKIDENSIQVLERSLNEIPHIVYPFQREGKKAWILVIGLKRDKEIIDKVLKDLAWENIEAKPDAEMFSKEAKAKLYKEISDDKQKITNLNEEIKKVSEEYKDVLCKIQTTVALKKSFFSAKKYSCATEKTVLLSGWVPLGEKDRVFKEVKKVSDLSYVEAKSPEEAHVSKDDVPVSLKHGFLFKPFELLISAYGIPRYGSIDPTIFVAITFLIMFGGMFGDLGHGFVLALASLFLIKAKNSAIKQAGYLLLYCGISSCVFGFLEGSVFGIEFKPIWIKPIDNIMQVFKVSVFFGICVITVGIILNIVNAFKDKDYLKLFFDKSGIISGVVYWGGIGLLVKSFLPTDKIPVLYLILIYGALLLLLLKPFIEMFFHKNEESLMTSFIESLVDILEVVMGYLANTVSFIRVAAFSLAHAGLFIAIFELAKVVHGEAGGSFSVLVLVCGNIFVIILEGMVVGIQSIRLNYYEFFSRFFISGKKVYSPLKFSKD
jgi:V/A-type H+-transporting ATPase subunit I